MKDKYIRPLSKRSSRRKQGYRYVVIRGYNVQCYCKTKEEALMEMHSKLAVRDGKLCIVCPSKYIVEV